MQKFIKVAGKHPVTIGLQLLKFHEGKHLVSNIDLSDYCIKAGEKYKIKLNGDQAYISVHCGFLDNDQIDLVRLSREELYHMSVVED